MVLYLKLEEALLNGQIDLAVRQRKGYACQAGKWALYCSCIKREYPGDVFLTRKDTDLASFKGERFIVGTSSPRRQCFFKEYWKELWESAGTGPAPELFFETLRGNVHTRLKKLKRRPV